SRGEDLEVGPHRACAQALSGVESPRHAVATRWKEPYRDHEDTTSTKTHEGFLYKTFFVRLRAFVLSWFPLYRSVNATMLLPEGAPFLPPPQTITTYCLPSIV